MDERITMTAKYWKTERDSHTGILERYYWDAESEVMTIRKTHDVTDIINSNKARANASIDQRFGNQMLHHVAEIPLGVVIKWQRELGIDVFSLDPDQKKRVLQLLDDPDWKYLKTTVKKLSRRRSTL